MTKPEYGDFYKFIASVGVVLLTLAILLPWLILRESFDVLHKASEISEMTTTAQEVIAYRQSTALWWVQNVGWFSGVLGLAGLIILVVGIVLWRIKQQVADTKESLEVKKLEKELTPMAPEQIAEKTIKEAEEVVAAIADEFPSVELPNMEEEPVITPSTMRKAVNEVFHIEQTIAAKLKKCFPTLGLRTHNSLIYRGAVFEYDLVLDRSPEGKDVIFEIKYRRNPIDRRTIQVATTKAIHSLIAYRTVTENKAVTLILFVTPYSVIHRERILQVINQTAEQENVDINDLLVEFIEPEGVDTLSCEQIRSMIRFGV